VKIRFSRRGGFGGIQLDMNVDTDGMDASQAQDVEELVQQAGFFTLRSTTLAPGAGADRFWYRIAVSSSTQGEHTVTLVEPAVPDLVQPLVVRLTAMALAKGAGSTDGQATDG
jgi:hypothetical protein